MERRAFLRESVSGLTAIGMAGCATVQTTAAPTGSAAFAAASRLQGSSGSAIRQSVCKWCFRDQTVEELAVAARRIGLSSIELLDPPDWPIVKAHGLTVALSNVAGKGGIPVGFNRVENHEWLIPAYLERIQQAAEAGVPNVICFSGNRAGMSDEEGLRNCAIGLKQITPAAEKAGVTIVMELLNSKVNHPDYMCDHTAWGVRLVDAVGSDRFRLLYDIYHMQIMEGDVIRTIQQNHQYIAHYHTAGNPGRHELDDSQELFYPAIMRAIQATGFTGFVAQEFVPTREPLAALEEAYRICLV